MSRILRPAVLLLLCAYLLPWTGAQDKGKFTVKSAEAAAPKELSDAIRKLLKTEALTFADASGQPVAEIWLRKTLPTDAAPERLKNGITYRELKQSEVLGAI